MAPRDLKFLKKISSKRTPNYSLFFLRFPCLYLGGGVSQGVIVLKGFLHKFPRTGIKDMLGNRVNFVLCKVGFVYMIQACKTCIISRNRVGQMFFCLTNKDLLHSFKAENHQRISIKMYLLYLWILWLFLLFLNYD